MNNTLSLKGAVKLETAIIDPALPQNCKKRWVATGSLIHDALRHSYLKMISEATEGDSIPISEAYLILAGKLPVMRHKRTEIGRNHLLAKHDNALSLFGSLSQGIEGRLKVGFISTPDENGSCVQNIRITNCTEEDVLLLIKILDTWSHSLYLGENTEFGFGAIEIDWKVSINNAEIGFILLKQGVMDTNIDGLAGLDTCR